MRPTGWYFLGSSFLPFLMTGVVFPLFQSPMTTFDCNDFSTVVDSGMTVTPVNSLRALGGISMSPTDLHTLRLLRCSWTWSLLGVGRTLLRLSPSCCPSTWKVWEQRAPLKNEAKTLLSTSPFSSFGTLKLNYTFFSCLLSHSFSWFCMIVTVFIVDYKFQIIENFFTFPLKRFLPWNLLRYYCMLIHMNWKGRFFDSRTFWWW